MGKMPNDAANAKMGDRSLFPELEARAYCNHAAISPPSRPVRDAALRALSDYAGRGLGAFPDWQTQREGLRDKCARLLGCESRDVALTSGTTRGVSDIALSIPWKRGDRVVLFEGEFPANVTPWQRAAQLFDLELHFLRAGDFESDAGLAALDEQLEQGVRLVAASAVQFQTGLRMPIERMAASCHEHGAELFVDAIQSLGIVPMDVRRSQVDYLTCGAHKWLMGVHGAGLLYVRPECVEKLTPPVAGWLSHENAEDFLRRGSGHLRYDRPLKRDVRVFEGGAPCLLELAALEPAIDLLLDLGIDAIFTHVQRYHDSLEAALLERGFRSRRSAHPDQRSGSLCLETPRGVDLAQLQAGLTDGGVSCSMPDGLLRFAPHWPNALSEVGAIVTTIDELTGR